MATQVQNRRGTTAQHSTFTGAVGEVTIDTDKDTVVVHDGATAGGRPLLREDGSNSALALGTAGTPSIKFTGDTNTGIYSPGADQVAISTNGTGRLFVDASGNVGIGTSSPLALYRSLSVAGPAAGEGGIFETRTSDSSTVGYFFSDSNGAFLQTATAHPLVFRTNNTERLRITSDGKVGVGTSSPSYRLHVEDNSTGIQQRISSSSTSGTTLSFVNTAANGRNYRIGSNFVTGNGEFALYDDTASASRIFVNSSGSVGVGTTSPGARLAVTGDGSSSANVQIINPSATNGAYLYLGDSIADASIRTIPVSGVGSNLAFYVNGASSERMRIDTAGRVGIGTSSPDSRLHVLDGSSNGLRIGYLAGSLNYNLYDAGIHQFRNNGGTTIHATIDSSGRLGIGTTSPDANLDVRGSNASILISDSGRTQYWRIQNNETNDALVFNANDTSERMRIDSSGRLLVGTSSTSTTTRALIQGNSSDSTGTGVLFVASGKNNPTSSEDLALLRFGDSGHARSAEIGVYRDGGTWTSGTSQPTRLTFSTTADGASTPTERMRITQAGGVRLPDVYNATIALSANVFIDTDGTLKRATSSIKYKTNVETLEDQYADAVLNCRPVWYKSTSAGDNPNWGFWGFIAEEVAEIDPRLVQWKTVEQVTNEDGSRDTVPLETPEPENVAYDRFVPHLLNLIKRQKEQIESLEARLSAAGI